VKSNVLTNKLSEELGIRVDPMRICQYEARGIIRSPRKLGLYKDYTGHDYERIKKTILLAELGIGLDDIRRYLMGVQTNEMEDVFKNRISRLSHLLEVAKHEWATT
jgi:DNA-binding transcriptional MerR regulator